MGKLIRNASPAAEMATKRFAEAAASADDRYPEGAIFIGSDEEHLGVVLAEAVAAAQPLIVVYPDGRELIGQTRDGEFVFSSLNGSSPRVSVRAHPLRVEILMILGQRPAHELELASELNQSLSNVYYHLRILAKFGFIDLVETKQWRGSTVHVYQAASLSQEAWEERLANVRPLDQRADEEP